MSVPLRRSLLVRLLAASVLVAVCAIAATTWLVMNMTTSAIRQEQGASLTDDARIYDALVGYAARNGDWSGVGPTLRGLAGQTGRRIVLTTPERVRIASSASAEDSSLPPALAPTASATVDPLAVDPALIPTATADRIDRRAVGPFRLTTAERSHVEALARRYVTCLRLDGFSARVERAPSGRTLVVGELPATSGCPPAFAQPTATERHALDRLAARANACLRRRGVASPLQLALDERGTPVALGASRAPRAARCLAAARREQLRGHVAPTALLFVTAPDGVASTTLDLSRENRVRVLGVAAIVLALTIAATVLAALRLLRPLRELTAAARLMEERGERVPVRERGGDELGQLAVAFNGMSRRREQLEHQRTAMVSDVAHELRTPVSNIRGWLEATQDGLAELDPALVSSLLDEATQLHRLIDDLQDLSAADAGELRLHREPVHVADLLGQVAAAHRPQADAEGLTIAVQGTRDLPLVEADPVRLRQAVGNLLANAIRHSPAGTTVTLRALAEADAIAIEVADEGAGIAHEDVDHVFDRFWRADKSRSRRAGGSGLGLAIVRKLAEAHGGDVTVSSVPGAGATFRLRLPAARPRLR